MKPLRTVFPNPLGRRLRVSRRLMDLNALTDDTFFQRPRAVTLASNLSRHQSELVVPFVSTLGNLEVDALSRILAGDDTVTRRPCPCSGVI